MKKLFEFLKAVFVKPIWLFLTIAWGILSNLPTCISLFEFLFKRDFTQYKDIFIRSPFFQFLSLYWIPILIVIYLLVVVGNLYKVALPRLGDSISADLEIELFPRQKEGYASVKIFNKEYDDLLSPELSYCELYIIKDGKLIPKLDKINGGAANISWWLGGQEKVIRGKKSAVFNLAKQEMVSFYFLFDDGSKPQAEEGTYKTVIAIDGKIGKERKRIKTIRKECFLEFSSINGKYYIDIRDRAESTSEKEPSEYGGPPIF